MSPGETKSAMEFLGDELRQALIEPTTVDMVNAPPHYCTGKFECIDVMTEIFGVKAVQDFCLCNAFKYLYRTNRKNGIEDIKKAQWYLNKFVELEETQK